MCSGISLSWRELPQAIINQHRLQGREIIRQEGADREFRFMYRDRRPLIPLSTLKRNPHLEMHTRGG